MWKKIIPENRPKEFAYQTDDYKALLRYINQLASHKLGYPVSLLTYLGIVNNEILGIKSGSIANILLNNVGDPFKDSETSLLEVKKHEREVIGMLERFYGLPPDGVRGYVTTGGTEGNFAALWWSKRYLINRSLDLLIKKDDELKRQAKEEQELTAALAKVSVSAHQARAELLQKIIDIKNAITHNKTLVQEILTPTVFYSKGHTHYSIPKISEILHLNIKPVSADDDGAIDLNELKKEVLLHMKAHPLSPIVVIANIGTTITGAIDYVPGIKKILDEVNPKPIYTIHMDGALTGFVLPIIKPFGLVENYFSAIGVNTLAVSAHKYPGLSQPCGIILANKFFFEKAFEKSERSIDYVGNIVDVTITGSRSGLNVLMFYNALCTLGLNNGYDFLNAMVNENLATAKYLYDELVKLYGAEYVRYPYHFNVMFPKPSKFLAKKYQLMITGETATICVLANVTKKLIQEFIHDLKIEKETEAMSKETITTQTGYTIQTLTKENAESATELFIKSFCDSEPITKHLGIRYQDYEGFANEVIKKAVKEGLSKVALDKNNKVIACALAEDIADPFIPHISHYPKLKPVFSLLDELSRPFLRGRVFHKGKILHIWIAAVDQPYRGQGLSTIIDMACIDNAARKGFDYAYAEFTNELSERVTSQFKVLKLCNKIKLSDFTTEEGEKPYKGLEGTTTSYVAAIRPGVKLENLENIYTTVAH